MDLVDPTKHTQLFDPEYDVANMIVDDGVILAGHYAASSPFATGVIISPDLGTTWAQYDLAEFGQRSPIRFHTKNSDGWFRLELPTVFHSSAVDVVEAISPAVHGVESKKRSMRYRELVSSSGGELIVGNGGVAVAVWRQVRKL